MQQVKCQWSVLFMSVSGAHVEWQKCVVLTPVFHCLLTLCLYGLRTVTALLSSYFGSPAGRPSFGLECCLSSQCFPMSAHSESAQKWQKEAKQQGTSVVYLPFYYLFGFLSLHQQITHCSSGRPCSPCWASCRRTRHLLRYELASQQKDVLLFCMWLQCKLTFDQCVETLAHEKDH